MARPKKENNDKVTRLSVSIKVTTMIALDKFTETKCMVKSKLVDKINYINQLESFISGKFKKFNSSNKLNPDDEGYLPTNFDLLKFI